MSHYFETPQTPGKRRELAVTLEGREVTVQVAPGVFSGSGIDLGTRVLLRETRDDPVAGTMLDLGCGWGPLALTAALRAPGAHVWAVDVNQVAVDLTRDNASQLALHNVRACLPDAVPADLRFDLIWSNPPIRIGKAALHELLATWLSRLTPSGTAALVVQRNLGSDSLQTWITDELGLECTRRASAKGFRVLQARRPAPTASR